MKRPPILVVPRKPVLDGDSAWEGALIALAFNALPAPGRVGEVVGATEAGGRLLLDVQFPAIDAHAAAIPVEDLIEVARGGYPRIPDPDPVTRLDDDL